MSTTTNVSTLKINYLTQSQYDTALSGGQINANEIYLTQAEDMTAQEVDDFVSELEIGGSDGIAVDLVVEQGTASTAAAANVPATWIYRKWSSGISECFGQVNVASRTYSANGGNYGFNFNYPPNLFISNPICVEVTGGLSGVVNTDIGFTANNSAAQGQTYLINRNGSAVTVAGWVFIHAVGSWK